MTWMSEDDRRELYRLEERIFEAKICRTLAAVLVFMLVPAAWIGGAVHVAEVLGTGAALWSFGLSSPLAMMAVRPLRDIDRIIQGMQAERRKRIGGGSEA